MNLLHACSCINAYTSSNVWISGLSVLMRNIRIETLCRMVIYVYLKTRD